MKLRRNFMIPEHLDRALGSVAKALNKDKSAIVSDAIKQYLPTISPHPGLLSLVQDAIEQDAIAKNKAA